MWNLRALFHRGRVELIAFWLMMCACLSGAVAAEDVTLERGYVSKNSASKGIVVYLHGCDGSFNTSPAADWHDWLERSGFKVFAPKIALPRIDHRPPARHRINTRPRSMRFA
jgi:hypothetical protein